jgi:sugar O-acyltransferase (sialic acid O-acetyltransferase NeuD family)
MKKILVYGSRDFGQVVKDIVLQCGFQFAGFIDDYYNGTDILGTYEQVQEKYSPDLYEIVIAIGYKHLKARWETYQKVINEGYTVPCLIHPKAYVRSTDAIGPGAIIMVGAVVDFNAQAEELTVLWPGAVLNHDSIVKSNTFLSPNSTICGFVTVGEGSFIGAGAVVADHVTVPAGSYIKARGLFYEGRKA